MKNNTVRIAISGLLALVGVAVAMVGAPDADAASRTCTLNTWPGSQQCFGDVPIGNPVTGGDSEGVGSGSSKKVGVRLYAGDATQARAQGLNGNTPISGCQKITTTVSSSSVYDTTGCSTANGHRLTIWY